MLKGTQSQTTLKKQVIIASLSNNVSKKVNFMSKIDPFNVRKSHRMLRVALHLKSCLNFSLLLKLVNSALSSPYKLDLIVFFFRNLHRKIIEKNCDAAFEIISRCPHPYYLNLANNYYQVRKVWFIFNLIMFYVLECICVKNLLF